MAQALLQVDVKHLFFDRAGVQSKMDKTTLRAFKKIGAMVRRVERNSIRVRPKPSQPGGPPHAHGSNSLLRGRIFFVWDEATKSVVIGPTLINSTRERPVGDTVPGALERGGTIVFERTIYRQVSATTGRVRERIRERILRPLKPRPYAEPALEKTRDRYPHLWADEWQGGGI
jgi:hypothetical protein